MTYSGTGDELKWERLSDKVGYYLGTWTKEEIMKLDTDTDTEHMLKGERREFKIMLKFLAFITGRSNTPSTKTGK